MVKEKKTRLQLRLEEELRKWPSQKVMAEHLGITPPFLNQLLTGKAKGERSLIDIARKLGVNPLELMENITAIPQEKLDEDGRIPVYTVSEAKQIYVGGGMDRVKLPGGTEVESMVPGEERERRIGILIETNTYQPVFLAGDVIVVDPGKRPSEGDLCMVILGDELLFRRLVRADDNETTYALPSDEFRQEVIKSSSPVRMEIWGRAVEVRRRL